MLTVAPLGTDSSSTAGAGGAGAAPGAAGPAVGPAGLRRRAGGGGGGLAPRSGPQQHEQHHRRGQLDHADDGEDPGPPARAGWARPAPGLDRRRPAAGSSGNVRRADVHQRRPSPTAAWGWAGRRCCRRSRGGTLSLASPSVAAAVRSSVQELAHARVAIGGVLGQRPQDGRLQRGRDGRVHLAGRIGRAVDVHVDHRPHRLGHERRAPAHHLVDDHPQAVDVAALVDRAPRPGTARGTCSGACPPASPNACGGPAPPAAPAAWPPRSPAP